MKTSNQHGAVAAQAAWDHSTHEAFFDYYAEESASPEAWIRFERIRDHILRFLPDGKTRLDVADVGCGAGTHSRIWAERGHAVHALDVNAALVELGRKRADEAGYKIDFRVGSATQLPWPDASMDVCIALELLEHVDDWESCMREFMRVVKPGGAVFVTTTNRLCPHQAEFNLPLYSWYPRRLQQYCEKLAFTTRPDIANYAKYPAVHWFTWYGLRRVLAKRGFRSLDRFDIMDLEEKGTAARALVKAIQILPPLRWVGQVFTPGTVILAIRNSTS